MRPARFRLVRANSAFILLLFLVQSLVVVVSLHDLPAWLWILFAFGAMGAFGLSGLFLHSLLKAYPRIITQLEDTLAISWPPIYAGIGVLLYAWPMGLFMLFEMNHGGAVREVNGKYVIQSNQYEEQLAGKEEFLEHKRYNLLGLSGLFLGFHACALTLSGIRVLSESESRRE